MKHVISHHNSGLLLQIQQSAWPGLREHSDSYQTGDGWHTTTTLTVSPLSLPFMSAWTRTHTHTQSKASDACYRWQTTEPVDVGHAAVCLLGLLTTMQQFKQNCDSAATTNLQQGCALFGEGDQYFNVFLFLCFWCKDPSSLFPLWIPINSVFSWCQLSYRHFAEWQII